MVFVDAVLFWLSPFCSPCFAGLFLSSGFGSFGGSSFGRFGGFGSGRSGCPGGHSSIPS